MTEREESHRDEGGTGEADGAALRWLVRRLDAGSWTEADEAAFDAWRAAAPENEQAFLRAEQTLGAMSQPEAFAAGEIDRVRSGGTAGRSTRFGRRRFFMTAAGLAAAGVVALLFVLRPATPQVYETAAGERREVRLPDGSQASLDAGTRLSYVVESGERVLRLESGAVVIDVAPNDDRGLVLQAGEASIRDIGTVFSVKRLARLDRAGASGEGLDVAVAEGRVDLEWSHGRGAESAPAPLRLDAFRRAVWTGGPETPEVSRFEPERFASWRDGRLHYRERPLSEVLADLQRHYGGGIELRQAWLGDLQVTGTLRSDQLEDALAVLQNILPIRIGEFTNRRLVIEHWRSR